MSFDVREVLLADRVTQGWESLFDAPNLPSASSFSWLPLPARFPRFKGCEVSRFLRRFCCFTLGSFINDFSFVLLVDGNTNLRLRLVVCTRAHGLWLVGSGYCFLLKLLLIADFQVDNHVGVGILLQCTACCNSFTANDPRAVISWGI